MLSDFTGADKVYIACGYTDLRRGIDGLAAMVQKQFHLDPFANTLFPVLRSTPGSDQGTVLGRERVCAALQEAGVGFFPMAQERK